MVLRVVNVRKEFTKLKAKQALSTQYEVLTGKALFGPQTPEQEDALVHTSISETLYGEALKERVEYTNHFTAAGAAWSVGKADLGTLMVVVPAALAMEVCTDLGSLLLERKLVGYGAADVDLHLKWRALWMKYNYMVVDFFSFF